MAAHGCECARMRTQGSCVFNTEHVQQVLQKTRTKKLFAY